MYSTRRSPVPVALTGQWWSTSLIAADALRIDRSGQEVDVRPGVAGGIRGKGGILIEDRVEMEKAKLLFEALLGGIHRLGGGWGS